MKELRLTEGRGTGIPKIRHSMNSNGSPLPIFETDSDNTYFLTVLPIHPEFTDIELDDYRISILQFCSSPRSKKEVLNYIGFSNYYGNFKRHMLPLIETGYLDQTFPDIPKHRNQKYQTSSKGNKKIS